MKVKYEIFKFAKVYWKVVLTVAIAVLLNIALVSFVGGARSNFLKKNDELNILSAKKSNLMQLKRQFDDISAVGERIKESFISGDNAVDFIILIEDIAKNTGNEIDIKSASENGAEGSRSFRVELTGNYLSFINFMAQLENSEKLAFASKVDIREYVNSETNERALKAILDIKALAI